VKDLWEVYRESIPLSETPLCERKPSQNLSELRKLMQDMHTFTRPASQDEFEDYCNGEPYDLGKITALWWWSREEHQKRWPRLSAMALDILSIPAMSDEPERVFSGARRTISWERAQLGPETIERLECLKHWEQSGILKE